jgi:hypothetical protein
MLRTEIDSVNERYC